MSDIIDENNKDSESSFLHKERIYIPSKEFEDKKNSIGIFISFLLFCSSVFFLLVVFYVIFSINVEDRSVSDKGSLTPIRSVEGDDIISDSVSLDAYQDKLLEESEQDSFYAEGEETLSSDVASSPQEETLDFVFSQKGSNEKNSIASYSLDRKEEIEQDLDSTSNDGDGRIIQIGIFKSAGNAYALKDRLQEDINFKKIKISSEIHVIAGNNLFIVEIHNSEDSPLMCKNLKDFGYDCFVRNR